MFVPEPEVEVGAYYSPAMEAARPPRRRRRPRRGSVDSPVNARLVRVSAIVVVPALLALLFSVSTPGTLPPPPLEPVFDADAAAAVAEQLSTEFPSRVPGTAEAAGAARWFEQTIAASGLRVETQSWTQALPGLGVVELRNVLAVVPGRSPGTIVVVAHRDNAGDDRPSGDNASGTSALIELARGFGPQASAPAPMPARTLVFLSTDGGAFGGAGAARFAEESPFVDDALVAVVLDGLGGPGSPRLAIAGDRPASPSRPLVSTTSARIAEQAGARPALPSAAAQLVDLAVPFAAGEQGRFLARGIAAVTLTTHEAGEAGIPSGDPPTGLAVPRLGQLGRATEALIGSIDASVGAAFGTPDGLFVGDRVASGWALRLTLVAAVAPFVLGVLDLLARARRRRVPFLAAVRALRSRVLVWTYAAVLVWIGALAGAFPTEPSLPPPPSSDVVADRSVAALGLLGIAFGLGWLVARRRLAPVERPAPEERLAGAATGLAWLAAIAVAASIAKPYALTFLLPSLYAWLWLPLAARPGARAALFLAGLAGPVAGLLVLGRELGLNPLDTAYYVAGLATVGYVSAWTVALAVAWVAAAGQLGAVAFGRYAPYAAGAEPPPPGSIRTTVGAIAARLRSRRYVSDT